MFYSSDRVDNMQKTKNEKENNLNLYHNGCKLLHHVLKYFFFLYQKCIKFNGYVYAFGSILFNSFVIYNSPGIGASNRRGRGENTFPHP